jgi:ABC-type nickel/cobalt efflux system permease component RcnA
MDLIPGSGKSMRAIPLLSALVITVIGALICFQALRQTGLNFGAIWNQSAQPTPTAEVIAILIIGFVYGLQHALDADHIAAVSTLVNDRKNLTGSMLIGGIWGLGHTFSLLLAGIIVLFLRVNIQRFEHPLEFCVAIMLIGLGANALYKLARGGRLHLHSHRHGGHTHFHPHLHDGSPEPDPRSHHGLQFGFRPLLIGMVHGLAGSAALMLIVLTKITSPIVGLAYIGLFGLGSIGGMIGMSALLGLPARLTADRFYRANLAVRFLAACFSFGLGLFMVYEIGFQEGLLR